MTAIPRFGGERGVKHGEELALDAVRELPPRYSMDVRERMT